MTATDEVDMDALERWLAELADRLTRVCAGRGTADMLLTFKPVSPSDRSIRGLEKTVWIPAVAAEVGEDAWDVRDDEGRLLARLSAPRGSRYIWTFRVWRR